MQTQKEVEMNKITQWWFIKMTEWWYHLLEASLHVLCTISFLVSKRLIKAKWGLLLANTWYCIRMEQTIMMTSETFQNALQSLAEYTCIDYMIKWKSAIAISNSYVIVNEYHLMLVLAVIYSSVKQNCRFKFSRTIRHGKNMPTSEN